MISELCKMQPVQSYKEFSIIFHSSKLILVFIISFDMISRMTFYRF